MAATAPEGYPAYGRLFHPARERDGRSTRWAEVAGVTDTAFGRCAKFSHVASRPNHRRAARSGKAALPSWRAWTPPIGYAFGRRSPTRRTISGTGSGTDSAGGTPPSSVPTLTSRRFPIPHSSPRRAQATCIRIPGRDHILYSGTLADALTWRPFPHQTPHRWWPADHRWGVATDVDLPCSILGGAPERIAHLVRDPNLEVLALATDDVSAPDPPAAPIEAPRGGVDFSLSFARDWLEFRAAERTQGAALARRGEAWQQGLAAAIRFGLFSALEVE